MATAKTRTRTTLAESVEIVNLCYYGDGGGGKTSDLARLSTRGKLHYVDAEGGLKKKPLLELGCNLDNIVVHRDHSYEALDALFWELKAELDDDPEAFVGVAWDSTTEVQKLQIEDIVDVQVAKFEAAGKERNPFTAYREDYGENTEAMRRLLRKYRDLPCHTGFSALERRDQDDDGEVAYGPAVTPAFGNDLYGYMDMVCHVETEMLEGEEIFVGRFRRGGGKYKAKDRFGAIPGALMVDPFYDRVIDVVNGDLDLDTDEKQQWVKNAKAEQKRKIAEAKAEKAQAATKKSAK